MMWPVNQIGKEVICNVYDFVGLTFGKSYHVYDVIYHKNYYTFKINNDFDSKQEYTVTCFSSKAAANTTGTKCVEAESEAIRQGLSPTIDEVSEMRRKEDLALAHKYPLHGYKQQTEATSYQDNITMTPIPKTPHCCPVCYGRGHVAAGFYTSTGQSWVTSNMMTETCKSCSGMGIVWG